MLKTNVTHKEMTKMINPFQHVVNKFAQDLNYEKRKVIDVFEEDLIISAKKNDKEALSRALYPIFGEEHPNVLLFVNTLLELYDADNNLQETDDTMEFRFVSFANGIQWLRLSKIKSCTDDDLVDRLKDFWNLTSAVSTLITGFTYVISNSNTSFSRSGILGQHRGDIFGSLVITTFLVALLATSIAVNLHGYCNLLGKEHVRELIQNYYFLMDIPAFLCSISIIVMLISATVAIGGFYSSWVWYYTLAIEIPLSLACILMIGKLENFTNKKLSPKDVAKKI